MIRHLGSSLTDVTYVFDEPTIGLHPHDIERMNDLLLACATRATRFSSWSTSLRPSPSPTTWSTSGRARAPPAATICFEGTRRRAASQRHAHRPAPRRPRTAQRVGTHAVGDDRDSRGDVPQPAERRRRHPARVSSSSSPASPARARARSSTAPWPGREGVVAIDQGAIKGSRRSNPATYTGLLEPIRKAFAKANGVKPALFSANSEGACPACNGAGVIYTELGIRRPASHPVRGRAAASGSRPAVLDYKLAGRDISRGSRHVGRRGASAFFSEGEAKIPAAHAILGRLADVGLGYLKLGQPLTTLSGGERQRLKLADTHGGEGRHLHPRRAHDGTAPRRRREACSACSTGWSTPASR